jgi:hypothetical protein
MENVTKEKVDDVLHAKWIIPVVPDNTVLENHSLVIKDGTPPKSLHIPSLFFSLIIYIFPSSFFQPSNIFCSFYCFLFYRQFLGGDGGNLF